MKIAIKTKNEFSILEEVTSIKILNGLIWVADDKIKLSFELRYIESIEIEEDYYIIKEERGKTND